MKKIFLSTAIILGLLFSTQTIAQNFSTVKELVEAKKYDDARKLLQGVDESNPNFNNAQFYLGMIAFGEAKYEDAIKYFEDLTEKNDKNADYFHWLGKTYGQQALTANIFKAGILVSKTKSALETAHQLAPKNTDVMASLIQFYLAAPEIMGGGADKALGVANQLQVLNKADGFFAKANIFMAQDNLDAAEKEFINAARTEPNNFRYISGLGVFYQKQKKYTQSLEIFEAFLIKNPTHMGAAYQFGKSSALAGQKLEKGEEYLKSYLKYKPASNEPSLAGASFRLGMIYEKQGKKQEAKQLFESAVKADPNLKEAKEALRRL